MLSVFLCAMASTYNVLLLQQQELTIILLRASFCEVRLYSYLRADTPP
jgi:hypothetical protein